MTAVPAHSNWPLLRPHHLVMPLHPRQGSRVTKSRHLSQLTRKDPHSPQDLQAAVGFTQGSIQHPCPAEVQIDGTEVQSLQSLAGDEGSGQVWAAVGGKLAGLQPGMEGTDLGSKLGWGDGFTHLIAHPHKNQEILPGRTGALTMLPGYCWSPTRQRGSQPCFLIFPWYCVNAPESAPESSPEPMRLTLGPPICSWGAPRLYTAFAPPRHPGGSGQASVPSACCHG